MNRFESYFDGHVYLINLDRRGDRLAQSESNLRRAGFGNWWHFPAVDGREHRYCQAGPLRAGEKGCLESHYYLMRRLVEMKVPRAMVFEDDFVLMPNAETEFFKRLPGVPADWRLMYLGANHVVRPTPVAAGVARVQNSLTTSSYAVTLEGATDLLALLGPEPSTRPVDVLFAEYQANQRCYTMYPGLASQRASWSDVVDRHTDYGYAFNAPGRLRPRR